MRDLTFQSRHSQRLANEDQVWLIVLNHEDADWFVAHADVAPVLIENLNVEPWPGVDSTQMTPPCFSTIFLQIASPIPVPGCSAPCKRLNTPKIFSWYADAMPKPLSRTERTTSWPLGSAEIQM